MLRKPTQCQVLLWTILFATIKCKNIKWRPETSLITNFVQRFIQPYIQSLRLTDDTPAHPSLNESQVLKAINKVIHDLRPYLQDDDIDNQLAEDDHDDTAIMEFRPLFSNNLREGKYSTETLQSNIHIYEKIKSDIKAALGKEAVSEQTKKMVSSALDDLIAQVIGNQCAWKSLDQSVAVFRNIRESSPNITIKEWDDIGKQYLNFLNSTNMSKLMVLFNSFYRFFTKVIKDTQNLSKKYIIKCHVVKVNETLDTKLRKQEEDTCDDIKICSDELKTFLIDFYKSLNDTAVSVFVNYAAMYSKDVNHEESQEKDSVPNVLSNLSNAVDSRVSKVFLQVLGKLSLDKNKGKEANVKILRHFVHITVKREIKLLKKHIATGLITLRTRLHRAVKQDININLQVELGNLEEDFKGRVCTVFVTCNGRVAGTRRAFDKAIPRFDRNSVYVTLQVSLNDRLKEAMLRSMKEREVSNYRKANTETFNRMDIEKYKNLNVTRTTTIKATTKNVKSNLKGFTK